MIMNSKFETGKIDDKSTCRAYWQWKLNTLTSLKNAKRMKDEKTKGPKEINEKKLMF